MTVDNAAYRSSPSASPLLRRDSSLPQGNTNNESLVINLSDSSHPSHIHPPTPHPIPPPTISEPSIAPSSSRSLDGSSQSTSVPSSNSPDDSTPARGGTSSRISNGTTTRSSPFESILWILIELIITIGQVITALLVIIFSRDEKPSAPLIVWVAGYILGCLVTIPLLILRLKYRNVIISAETSSLLLEEFTSSSTSPETVDTHVSLTSPGVTNIIRSELRRSDRRRDTSEQRLQRRNVLLIDRIKMSMDCFFALWFILGNIWVFGGHISSNHSPNLYSLFLALLILMCVGYSMPFIICASVCICLPCLLVFLQVTDQPMRGKGASDQTIKALPVCKFVSWGGPGEEKAKSGYSSKSDFLANCVSKSNSLSDNEPENSVGGLIWAGTSKERVVTAEDASCCICLLRYDNGVELRELPCLHHFHVSCVDKWLKINGCCPLCKLPIVVPTAEENKSSQNESSSSSEPSQPTNINDHPAEQA